MNCPFLSRSSAHCRAIAGDPQSVPRGVVAASCRGAHESCPAFRYLRATGHGAHPADFRAWVLRGIKPGRTEVDPDTASVANQG